MMVSGPHTLHQPLSDESRVRKFGGECGLYRVQHWSFDAESARDNAAHGHRMKDSRFSSSRIPALRSGRHTRTNANMSLLTVLRVTTGLMAAVLSSCVFGAELFRCESEEDLDGSNCRVDMLPDEALAEMIYERCVELLLWTAAVDDGF